MEITYDETNEKYIVATFKDFNLIIMKSNRYFNASKLFSNNKLSAWAKIEKNTELINICAEYNNIEDPFIKIKDDNDEYCGTFVHENLIHHVAYHVDQEIAIKTAIIVKHFNNHYAKFDSIYNKSNKSSSDNIFLIFLDDNEKFKAVNILKKNYTKKTNEYIQQTLFFEKIIGQHFWKTFKKIYSKNKIICKYNSFTLNDISQDEFKELLNNHQ